MSDNTSILSHEEFSAIKDRVLDLYKTERVHPGLVLGRCNGKIDSTRSFLRKRLKSEDSVKRCLDVLEENGGYCNCEILYNVLPVLDTMEKKYTNTHTEDE